jgi:hypothetical protein
MFVLQVYCSVSARQGLKDDYYTYRVTIYAIIPSRYCLLLRRYSRTVVTKVIDMNIILKIRSLGNVIFTIDNDADRRGKGAK